LNNILTVSALNAYLASRFREDENLEGLFIKGEIIEYKPYPKADYLTLSDSGGILKCVMWKSSSAYLRFKPTIGMNVIAEGNVAVYEKNGAYQLYIASMTPAGVGEAAVGLEQLKEKLAAKGLFDALKKRPLPDFPKKIAVVAGANSAALRDILNILNRRNPLIEIELFPSAVQGETAPSQIVGAIESADNCGADIIICGRGGGGAEDLSCFSDERVVVAFGSTKTPIISAIGHETDNPLCDLSADLRAPTPSAAAELAVPDVYSVLAAYEKRLFAVRPKRKLDDSEMILISLKKRLKLAAENAVKSAESRLLQDIKNLEAVNPLSVLSRGYAVVEKDGVAVLGVKNLSPDDKIRLKMQDGEIEAIIA
jgi:exodeoxyribonuclease VII large subunit